MSTSPSATSCTASSVAPPAKTERRRNSVRSSSDRRSWLHSIVLRSVRWRGSASRSRTRGRAGPRCLRGAASPRRGAAVRPRVAARAESVEPLEQRRQCRGRLHRRTERVGSCEEERLRVVRGLITGTSKIRSPASWRRSRLVTSRTRLGADSTRAATRSPSSGSRCSALSSRRSVRRPPRCRSTDVPRSASASSSIASTSSISVLGGGRVVEGSERDPPQPPGTSTRSRSQRDREPRLADPARPDDGEEAGPGIGEQVHGRRDLGLAADERRRRNGQVRRRDRLQGRERSVAELVQALGRREILQPVIAQVDEPVIADHRGGRRRDEHLATVTDGGDPRRSMDVHPHVPLVRRERRPRVDARREPGSVRGPSASWKVPAASSAPVAVGNAAKNASPWVSTSTPPWRTNASRRSRRCSPSASAYAASPSSWRSFVEPSTSVNRNVTVPRGEVGSGHDRASIRLALRAKAKG